MRTVKPLLRSMFIPGMLFLGACCCQEDVVVAPEVIPPPSVELGDIFFDYDKSELRAEAVQQLQKNFDWMKQNVTGTLIVEGHCDERGTNEYNMALGERRANAAKDYMVNIGADPARMQAVSFGEERPFALGHDEASWAQNRRAHFVGQGAAAPAPAAK
ncbi:MAG: peptidoglycan-associated lipoprotein Pal [Chlorobium sp.]|uniref:peptidoglycan-associated lipoprotein Pal n=1 Tax=Chlorobium sp. TaxID=1095 RepID=UPI0025C04FAF|nr:peptidoglycan-associated lipoprotein Pal [Chlorobium sp.]MCF8382145.1 peptidoglycan-associated lipoprotein Pal [Chlorobium sp.]